MRRFPAGDSKEAVKYLCSEKKFKFIKEVNSNMSWKREYMLQDILFAIKKGTYNVLNQGLTEEDKEYLYKSVSAFVIKHKFDTHKSRYVNAKFKLFILQKTI